MSLVVLAPARPGAADTDPFRKGFTLVAWSSEAYADPRVEAQLDALRDAGVEWIALTPHWFQATRSATSIAPHLTRSPSDASLRRVIEQAHARGFRVLLKPHVELLGSGWRGEISFTSEDAWSTWFESYVRFVLHYARLAAETDIELLCVGVELDGTRHRDGEWRSTIRRVREVFPGPLTFAANWGRERDIRWWDALDYAGVDAYFPLAQSADPPADELTASWSRHLSGLRAWARAIDRPVIFTEIGYRSVAGAAAQPWAWQDEGTPDADEQALLYRAALEAVWSEPWIAGLFWWEWRTAPPDRPQDDTSFTPQGKPALDVLREFYLSSSALP